MCTKSFNLTLVLVLFLTQNSKAVRFRRQVESIGRPFYKIVMSLGLCKETVLFIDQKVWSEMVFNRVLDISFKCSTDRIAISKVEIALVINNTNSYAYSEEGVGHSDFFATLYLPTNLSFVFYSLTIYSCNKDSDEAGSNINATHSYLPFLHKDSNDSDDYYDHDNGQYNAAPGE